MQQEEKTWVKTVLLWRKVYSLELLMINKYSYLLGCSRKIVLHKLQHENLHFNKKL